MKRLILLAGFVLTCVSAIVFAEPASTDKKDPLHNNIELINDTTVIYHDINWFEIIAPEKVNTVIYNENNEPVYKNKGTFKIDLGKAGNYKIVTSSNITGTKYKKEYIEGY